MLAVMDIYWENCTLRSFLNGYGAESNTAGIDYSEKPGDSFFNTAFTADEQRAIECSTVSNPDNYYFGTPCGNSTEDYVFIPSEQVIFLSDTAMKRGFAQSDGTDDPARRFRPTMYSMARGAWYSPVEENKGNGFWLLRTSGYTPSNANYICDFGYIYNRGTDVSCNDSGVLPAIRIDLTKAKTEAAGKVSDKR